MTDWKKLQRALSYSRRNPGKNVVLSNLAAETGQSRFHAHRTLRALLGETPKHFTLRLRVDRAAAALISSAASVDSEESTAGESEGDVLAETLPGGPAAVTIHSGPYDQLHAAYPALEEWIAANGFHPAGAPWEAYLNDPADHPNPQDWKTEVCWPIGT
jgi:AraC-like DNA-binding protein